MKCVLCETGTLKKGKTTVTLTKGDSIVIFKQVPALICDQCGHYNLESATAKQLLKLAHEALKKGTELEIINLKAA